jgi:hypothetical protein
MYTDRDNAGAKDRKALIHPAPAAVYSEIDYDDGDTP